MDVAAMLKHQLMLVEKLDRKLEIRRKVLIKPHVYPKDALGGSVGVGEYER